MLYPYIPTFGLAHPITAFRKPLLEWKNQWLIDCNEDRNLLDWNNNDITFTWQIACLNMGTVWILAQHQVIDRKVNTHDVDSNLKLHYIYSLYHDALRWRHNDHDGASNHQPRGCLLNRLFGRRSKKTSKLRVMVFVRGIHRDRWIPRTKGQ